MSQERAMIEARISYEFSKLEAKLAASEKRMREVAEEMRQRANEDTQVTVMVFLPQWRAKLLEGIE